MNNEDINDAELDAFLKGEDALSGELQAMQQASPSAELDAAILGRAEAQMVRDNRPAAANDASDGRVSKPGLPRLGLRWRVPAGIAATLMAGVMAHQAWQASSDMDRAALPRQSEAVTLSAPAPKDAAEAEKPAAPAPVPMIATPVPPARLKKSARHHSVPPADAPPADAAAYSPEAAPPPPPPALRYAPPPAPAAAPAPAISELARAMPARPAAVEVSGRRSRVEAQRSSAPEPRQSGAMPAGTPDPTAWLAAIDELLKVGLRRDTLEEWDKFRAAYPDYPVPAETTDKINALRK